MEDLKKQLETLKNSEQAILKKISKITYMTNLAASAELFKKKAVDDEEIEVVEDVKNYLAVSAKLLEKGFNLRSIMDDLTKKLLETGGPRVQSSQASPANAQTASNVVQMSKSESADGNGNMWIAGQKALLGCTENLIGTSNEIHKLGPGCTVQIMQVKPDSAHCRIIEKDMKPLTFWTPLENLEVING